MTGGTGRHNPERFSQGIPGHRRPIRSFWATVISYPDFGPATIAVFADVGSVFNSEPGHAADQHRISARLSAYRSGRLTGLGPEQRAGSGIARRSFITGPLWTKTTNNEFCAGTVSAAHVAFAEVKAFRPRRVQQKLALRVDDSASVRERFQVQRRARVPIRCLSLTFRSGGSNTTHPNAKTGFTQELRGCFAGNERV